MSTHDYNAPIIAEFRKNHGKVGGYFEGAPILLLHTVGAHSGKPHVNPVMYLPDGNRYVVFASKAGADSHPDWYYNIIAHPDIQIEVGDEKIDVHGEDISGHERGQLYKRQATIYPQFAEYETKTKRVIPVIAFTRKQK
jgi:deazaflavin-dependent oxidoreductase (nitroreductase family)